jgi:hypothetical protein
MAQHNVVTLYSYIYTCSKATERSLRYAVPKHYRKISPTLLNKHHRTIHSFMLSALRLTHKQTRVAEILLRLWCYYGHVYPKAQTIADECMVSKRTVWRTIQILEDMHFISRNARYFTPSRNRISNSYDCSQFCTAIAFLLYEKSVKLKYGWLQPYFRIPGSVFWSLVYTKFLDDYVKHIS